MRAQILATEHWSLLAARDVTYRAVFSRATIFLTVVSAAVVALALVARATELGNGFTAFAFLVLPIALFVGVANLRLIEARIDDFWLLSGMNRLRHAYLKIAPELEPHFVNGHHDDEQGLYETYGPGTKSRFYRLIGETSTLVAVINAALAGVVAGLVANAAGTGIELSLFIGAVVTTVLVVWLVNTSRRLIERGRRLLGPLPTTGRRPTGVRLVDVQLAQQRKRVVERLKQILVALDHLAAHVDAKPLLVAV